MQETLKCLKCKEIKLIKCFGVNSKVKNGHVCNTCKYSYQRKYSKNNKDKIEIKRKEREKKATEEYKLKLYLKQKEYRERTKEERSKQKKEYRERNKEKLQEYVENNRGYYKEYYEKNKDQINAKRKEYDKKESSKIKRRERIQKKLNTDLNFRLKTVLRSRLKDVVKNQYAEKKIDTFSLIGCDINFLRKHLESQFQDGMSWDNYGLHGWHVDHILPCASFDLTDEQQQKECFNYKNLQPLWAKDNLSKGCKIPSR